MSEDSPRFVTSSQLSAEIRAMRWEMRFLIVAAAVGNLTLAKAVNIPGFAHAAGFVHNLF